MWRADIGGRPWPDLPLELENEWIVDPKLHAIRQRRKAGFVHSESFSWGAASFYYRPPSAQQEKQGYECVCHRRSHWITHKNGNKTQCSRTMYFSTEEERLLAIKNLKYWVAAADDCETKSDHQKLSKTMKWLPDEDALENLKPESDREFTDEEFADLPFPRKKRRRASRPSTSKSSKTEKSKTSKAKKSKPKKLNSSQSSSEDSDSD